MNYKKHGKHCIHKKKRRFKTVIPIDPEPPFTETVVNALLAADIPLNNSKF